MDVTYNLIRDMAERSFKDAKEARYLRKQQQQAGFDEQQQQQDQAFREDVERAVNTYSKGAATKDLQKQIEYFGYKIQPFNMKQEQQMGDIDEDGFFVFSKKRQLKDAWLQSLEENDGQGAVDTLRKKIKEEHRFQNVYDADPNKNEDVDDDQDEEGNKEEEEAEKEEEEGDKFDGKEIKIILADLLPFGTNANQYLKRLKQQKDTELYTKILYLCNEYVSSTGQHDIFTLKKEDLEEQVEEEPEAPLNDWRQEESSQNQPLNDVAPSKDKPQENGDDDDIF